jgi:hypothetical protein
MTVPGSFRACALAAVVVLGASAPPTRAQLVFGPAAHTVLPPFAPPHFALGDVNGDGFADAVLGYGGTPFLRLGDGAGHFGLPVPMATDAEGGTVALADLDGDGILDLLAGSSVQDALLSLAMGTGGGAFAPAKTYPVGFIPGSGNYLRLDVRDADGDGDLDVLAVTLGALFGFNGEVRLYRYIGGGNLGHVDAVPPPEGYVVTAGRLGSLNGDARPDAVISFVNISAGITSTRAYLCSPTADLLQSWSVSDVVVRALDDLDGDGALDLLTTRYQPSDVFVGAHLGDGAGHFGAETTVASGSANLRVTCLEDLDADGSVDLALDDGGPTRELSILRGLGDGSFAPATAHVTVGPVSLGAAASMVGDLDGDGRPDIVVACGSDFDPLLAATLNRTYAAGGPLLDLGHQLEGATWPIQIAAGSFLAGEPFSFTLHGAPPAGAAYLVVGASQLLAPFKGGVLVPAPDAVTGPWIADASGTVALAGLMPEGLPAGATLTLQFWFPSASTPKGYAASSGVLVTMP